MLSRKLTILIVMGLLVLASLLIVGNFVSSWGDDSGPSVAVADDDDDDFKYQYAATFVCGFDPQPAIQRVQPGTYATTIAIHNPQRESVDIRKKIALTFLPHEQEPGVVSEFLTHGLDANKALQVDCEEIFNIKDGNASEFFPVGFPAPFTTSTPPYIQGFVVVESSHSIDVVQTTSASASNPAGVLLVQSLDVEEVSERRIGGDDDD